MTSDESREAIRAARIAAALANEQPAAEVVTEAVSADEQADADLRAQVVRELRPGVEAAVRAEIAPQIAAEIRPQIEAEVRQAILSEELAKPRTNTRDSELDRRAARQVGIAMVDDGDQTYWEVSDFHAITRHRTEQVARADLEQKRAAARSELARNLP